MSQETEVYEASLFLSSEFSRFVLTTSWKRFTGSKCYARCYRVPYRETSEEVRRMFEDLRGFLSALQDRGKFERINGRTKLDH